MKHLYSLLAFGLVSMSAMAAMPKAKAPAVAAPHAAPAMETVAKAPVMKSISAPEESFTADKAQMFFYKDFYKDGENSAYQLVMTNCPDGFTDHLSGGGTLPASFGQLICAFLVGPNSENVEEPIIPDGTYTFSKTAGAPFSFSSKYGHYVDAIDVDGQILAWQMTLTGGTIKITREGKIYKVEADITAEQEDETTGEVVKANVKATYEGTIAEPGPMPELGGPVYTMDVPNFGGLYDPSQKVFVINMWGTPIDSEGFISGAGDYFLSYLYYDAAANNGVNPLYALPGTYEYTDYLDFANYSNYHYLGGYWYEFAGISLPMGTYGARYNNNGTTVACSMAKSGTIKVTQVPGGGVGDLTFDVDLETTAGNKFVATWTGNVLDKIQGLDLSSIDNIEVKAEIYGLKGRIQAPEGAKAYTLTGAACGTEDLPAGIYIVVYNGTSTKVVVK